MKNIFEHQVDQSILKKKIILFITEKFFKICIQCILNSREKKWFYNEAWLYIFTYVKNYFILKLHF